MSKIKLGGYSQIDLSSDTIYNDLQEIKNIDKPVIVYDSNENKPYFADTITGGNITTEIVDDEEITTYGDFTITKGGKTITITSANAVSSTGEIVKHLYQHNISVASTPDKYYLRFTILDNIKDKFTKENIVERLEPYVNVMATGRTIDATEPFLRNVDFVNQTATSIDVCKNVIGVNSDGDDLYFHYSNPNKVASSGIGDTSFDNIATVYDDVIELL